MAKDLNVH